jgi:endonuclease-3
MVGHEKRKHRPLLRHAAGGQPQPETELEYSTRVRAAGRRAAVGAGHRRGREQGDAPAVPGGQHAAGHPGPGLERLEDYIKTIGLYRTKAKNLLETCRMLVEQHGGEVPRTREELEALPGVGRKTANVVLNVAFGEPTMAVDTHIFRVGNRTGLAPGKTRCRSS